MTRRGLLLPPWASTRGPNVWRAKLTGASAGKPPAAHRRLTDPEEMGSLFKAMPLSHPAGAPTPGFAMMLERITSDALTARHGFFTRKGGASSGIFAG
jgi:hypothetical protein